MGSEEATTVPVAVWVSWKPTPRLPPSRSDTGAYSETVPSPTVLGGLALQDVAGEVVSPVGWFGGWLYVMDRVGLPDWFGDANSFHPYTSVDSFDAWNRNVCVDLPDDTSAEIAEVTLNPMPAAGHEELYPCAADTASTRAPRFTPDHEFQVALPDESVVPGAYTSTVRAEQEYEYTLVRFSCADWIVAPCRVPRSSPKLTRVCDHMLPELPTCRYPCGSGVLSQ